MRRIYWAVLLLFLVQQASSRQLDKRKSTRRPALDYDPNRQTLQLNISLGRALGPVRRLVNNIKIQVLKLPGSDCVERRCSEPKLDAAVVQSRRLCLSPSAIAAGIWCDQTVAAGRNEASISLQHIYTGCYCFRLATYHNDSIRTALQLIDQPRFLHTNVTEYDVFKWNLTLDLSATSEHDMSLFIRLDESAPQFDSFHVELFRHEHNDQDLLACHETDDPMNEQLSFASGDEFFHWMMFLNRSTGYYCVVVTPEDDRCHPPLIDPEKSCTRHSNIVFLRGVPKSVLTYYSENDVMGYWIAGLVIVLAVSSIVTVCVWFKRPKIKIDFPHYQPVNVPNITITDSPVLLLYSRLNNNDRLADLKQAIRNSHTKIYDEVDDEYSVDVDGVEWFSNKFKEPNIRIVIIYCPEMIRCQEALELPTDVDGHDRPSDLVCYYRLKELLYRFVHNSYQQIFAVHFDDLEFGGNRTGQISCLLTPYRSYHWPSARDALLKDLRQGYSNCVLSN